MKSKKTSFDADMVVCGAGTKQLTVSHRRGRFEGVAHFVDRTWPYLLAALFTLGLFAVARHHEMWRDEIQAWLIARDSPNLVSLLSKMKYEGIPALWYTILWGISRFTHNPFWMQAVHVLIAGTSAFLLLRFSPFPIIVRVLILLGYFFAYEWSVIARTYALSPLILFLICATYRERWRRMPLLGLLVALLCQTNIYGMIIGAVFVVTWMIEFLVVYLRKLGPARQYLRRSLLGFAAAIAGFLISIWQVWPPPDLGFAPEWHFDWSKARAEETASAAVNALLPLPVNDREFWGHNRFLEASQNSRWPVVPMDRRIMIAFWILAAFCLFFFKRPWLMVPMILGYLGILSFMYVKYFGFIRHHGFLYLLFIVLLWMSNDHRPWSLGSGWLERVLARVDRFRYYALLPILFIHVAGAWTAVSIDWKEPFSQATAAARWLRQQYPDTSHVVFVGDHSPQVSAVVGQVPLNKVFYSARDEFGSYIIWDNHSTSDGPEHLLGAAERLSAGNEERVVIISDYEFQHPNVRLLQKFEGAIVNDEHYYVYEWLRPGV